MKKILIILFAFTLKFAYAYEIKGNLKLSEKWQPIIYLASINSPNDLFVASPEFIIDSSPIADDGSFSISGDDLPEDDRFYRLYLVQNSFAAVEFYNQPIRNFMHIIFNNKDIIEIRNENPEDIFNQIIFKESPNNTRLHNFENEYFQKKAQLDEGNTKAKRDFLDIHLNKFIRDYTQSCNNALLGLFALYHIDDKETDFLRNNNFYFDFQEKINHDYPNSPYTHYYDELLNELIGFREIVCKIPQISSPWKNWVIGIESFLIITLIILLFRKKKRNKKNTTDIQSLLSDKELKILKCMSEGKANKEIAAELFIELSTVKTHINSINKKLSTRNRKEATAIYKQAIDKGIEGV